MNLVQQRGLAPLPVLVALALGLSPRSTNAQMLRSIESTPPGATVQVVRGESVTAGSVGVTPIRNYRTPAGVTQLRFTLARHVPITIDVGSAIDGRLSAALSPAARLRVEASNPEALISVDGAAVPAGAAVLDEVVPGAHVVEVVAEGFLPWRQQLNAMAGQESVVRAILVRQRDASASAVRRIIEVERPRPVLGPFVTSVSIVAAVIAPFKCTGYYWDGSGRANAAQAAAVQANWSALADGASGAVAMLNPAAGAAVEVARQIIPAIAGIYNDTSGAPDVYATLSVDGIRLVQTEVVPDSFEAFWPGAQTAPLSLTPSSEIVVVFTDRDASGVPLLQHLNPDDEIGFCRVHGIPVTSQDGIVEPVSVSCFGRVLAATLRLSPAPPNDVVRSTVSDTIQR